MNLQKRSSNCGQCKKKKLLGRIGATIVGVKPAEFLTISDDEIEWEEFKNIVNTFNKIKLIEINKRNQKRKALFYHVSCLDKVLQKKYHQKFLKKLGYPREYCLQSYINHLEKKIYEDESLPQEIGLFLGYPLKDVMGFMDCCPFRLVEVKGWRIYGSRELSIKVYCKFRRARERFLNYLNRQKSLGGMNEAEYNYNI